MPCAPQVQVLSTRKGIVHFHFAYPQWCAMDPQRLELGEFQARFEHYNERYDRGAEMKYVLRPVPQEPVDVAPAKRVPSRRRVSSTRPARR
jgi:hypothetical protein